MRETINRSSRSAKAERRNAWLQRQRMTSVTSKGIEIPENATFIVRVKGKGDTQLSKIGAVCAYRLRLVRIEKLANTDSGPQVIFSISENHEIAWKDLEGLLHLIAKDSAIAPSSVASALRSWLGKLIKQQGRNYG